MSNNIQDSIITFFGTHAWAFVSGFLILLFKNTIENIFNGMKFFFGDEYNVDDIVYLNEKKCRIIRQNIFRTTFYIIETNRKFHISNIKLNDYIIEKELEQK